MVRIILLVIFCWLAVSGIILAVNYNARAGVAPSSQVAALGASPAATSTSTAIFVNTFDADATLTYYPDNLGQQIPYVVYKTTNGATATRILDFGSSSRCATSQGTFPCSLIADAFTHYYGGGPVHVVGSIVNEHIAVDSVSPA